MCHRIFIHRAARAAYTSSACVSISARDYLQTNHGAVVGRLAPPTAAAPCPCAARRKPARSSASVPHRDLLAAPHSFSSCSRFVSNTRATSRRMCCACTRTDGKYRHFEGMKYDVGLQGVSGCSEMAFYISPSSAHESMLWPQTLMLWPHTHIQRARRCAPDKSQRECLAGRYGFDGLGSLVPRVIHAPLSLWCTPRSTAWSC